MLCQHAERTAIAAPMRHGEISQAREVRSGTRGPSSALRRPPHFAQDGQELKLATED